jgi:hypothetical protein
VGPRRFAARETRSQGSLGSSERLKNVCHEASKGGLSEGLDQKAASGC